jgi:protease-4
MQGQARSSSGAKSVLLWVLLPLLAGLALATRVPRPVIGLIYLNDSIYAYSARDMISQLDYARQHPEVRAVVLVMDSPGGTVVDTEAIYLELARLRKSKPVVTMAQGMIASGAFYLSVGTDYVVAGPSAIIGNIGVISQLPPPPEVYEDLASTGPYKLFGSSRDAQLRSMEAIKQAFLQAVQLGRGDRLQIGPQRLLTGEIWLGTEALRMGLVDEVGSVSQSVERAADLARVAHYRVVDLRQLAELPPSITYYFFYETPEGVLTPYPRQPGLYLLYVPPWEGG